MKIRHQIEELTWRLVKPTATYFMGKAWDDCVEEAYYLGWLHETAYDDMLRRNPHRDGDKE